jgi:O-antigen ligase
MDRMAMSFTGQSYDRLKPHRIGPFNLASAIALLATVLVALPYISPLAVLTVAGLALLVAAYFSYDPLLYAVIFFLPIEPLIQVDGFPIHDLSSLMRVVIFGAVLAKKVTSDEPMQDWLWQGGLEKLNLLYCLIALVSAAVANPLETGAVHALFRLISYVCLFYTVTGWVRSQSQLRAILAILFASTIATCIIAYSQVALNDLGDWYRALYTGQEEFFEPWTGRVTSVFLRTNPYAGYLNLILPLALAVWNSQTFTRRFRLAGRICFFMATVTLVLVESRGAFLGFFFMIAVALRYIVKTKSARKAFFIDLALALAIGAVVSSAAEQAARIPSVGPSVSFEDRLTTLDEATLTRLFIFASAWGMFVSSPVFGIGYGNFRSHLTPMMGDAPNDVWDTHNLYLKLLSETGIVGFACFFALILAAVRTARKICKDNSGSLEAALAGALLGAIATLLVHGMVEVMNEVPAYGAMLWLLFGMFRAANCLTPANAVSTRGASV